MPEGETWLRCWQINAITITAPVTLWMEICVVKLSRCANERMRMGPEWSASSFMVVEWQSHSFPGCSFPIGYAINR